MYTHRIEVFDGTDDDAVVVFIADNFHLILFPANQRLINQQLIGGGQLHTTCAYFNKLFLVIGNTTTSAAHGERGTNDAGETHFIQRLEGLLHAARNAMAWRCQPDGFHRIIKQLTILCLVD